jgi:endonuclease-3
MAAESVRKAVRKLTAKQEAALAQRQARVRELLKILKREYPEAKCSLDFRNAYELVCATILSAQCTDERVNKVTPALFERYPDVQSMARGKLSEIEKIIKTTGFFRAKALSLKTCAELIVERHGGEVPRTMEELVELRGIGRKTANVVLGNVFGIPGIPVDTHVGRLSRRLGLSEHADPVKVEFDLMALTPREDWTIISHLLIFHGRAICTARRAFCEKCPLSRLCPKIGVGG